MFVEKDPDAAAAAIVYTDHFAYNLYTAQTNKIAVILGPVGLLVGAASVGIGMGVMQIPEEQRNNVQKQASASLEKARDIACDLSDSMSTNCARYNSNGGEGGSNSDGTHQPGIMDNVGRVIPEEILDTCCHSGMMMGGDDGGSVVRGGGGAGGGGGTTGGGLGTGGGGRHYHSRPGGGNSIMGGDDGHSLNDHQDHYHPHGLEIRSEGSSPIANAVNGVERGMNRLVGDVFGDEQHSSPISQPNMVGGDRGGVLGAAGGDVLMNGQEKEDAGRRVACGRKGKEAGCLGWFCK